MEEEVWRGIPGVDGPYQVSNLGRVRSIYAMRNRILKPYLNGKGRQQIHLRRGVQRYVHELVLTTFIGPRPAGYEANHKNGIPTDNRLDNLEWILKAEHRAFHCGKGYFKLGNKYIVHVKLNGKRVRVGKYGTESEAVMVRDAIRTLRVELVEDLKSKSA